MSLVYVTVVRVVMVGVVVVIVVVVVVVVVLIITESSSSSNNNRKFLVVVMFVVYDTKNSLYINDDIAQRNLIHIFVVELDGGKMSIEIILPSFCV